MASPLSAHPGFAIISHWMSEAWNNIPSQMIPNTWCHIGHFTQKVVAHLDPTIVEENNGHDPLALRDGNVQCCKKDEECDCNAPLESMEH